jgi:hypothetical protein
MGNEPGIGGAGLPDTPALPCVMPRSIAADTRKLFYRSNAPEAGNRRFWHRKLFRENYSRRQQDASEYSLQRGGDYQRDRGKAIASDPATCGTQR